MSEVTSALGFDDLILRIAREAGIAYYHTTNDGIAAVPVDRHDLNLCIEIANDGIRRFISDSPSKGWRWQSRIASVSVKATRVTGTAEATTNATTITNAALETSYGTNDDLNGWYIYILTGTGAGSWAVITDYVTSGGVITVADWLDAYGNPGGTDPVVGDTFAITEIETVGGDIHRYPLPEYFAGEIDGPIEYSADSNHATRIEWRDEAFIRARRAVSVITAYPMYAAIRPLEHSPAGFGPKRRFEIIFDPQPNSDQTVEFPYTVHFNNLQLESGYSSASDSTSITDSSLADLYPDDYFNGWKIKITNGTGLNSNALVTDYTGSSGKFDVADWLSIDGTAAGKDPATTTPFSSYVVQPVNNLHPAGIRFDEAIKAAILAEAEERIEDMAGSYVQKYQGEKQKAWAIDLRAAPRKLGQMRKSMDHRHIHRLRNEVTTEWDI